MRVFEAYGTQQLVSLAAAQAQGLTNLNYTQAFIRLGVPEEEWAQFIVEIDMETMSTRELQKVVEVTGATVREVLC